MKFELSTYDGCSRWLKLSREDVAEILRDAHSRGVRQSYSRLMERPLRENQGPGFCAFGVCLEALRASAPDEYTWDNAGHLVEKAHGHFVYVSITAPEGAPSLVNKILQWNDEKHYPFDRIADELLRLEV